MSEDLGTPDGASNYTPPTYDIAPEDQHIVDEILATDVASLPGTSTASEGVRLPDTIPLAALPPRLREAAQAKLVGVPSHRRAAAEEAAVMEVLRENSLDIRSRAGFAESAEPYYVELAAITREANDCLAEYDRLNEELVRVAHYETVVGEDGQSKPQPIFAASPARRRAIAIRQAELLHRHDLLAGPDGSHGIEAQRRLNRALAETVELRKQRRAQVEEHREAAELADKMVRDERIARKAEALAKGRRHTL